MKNTLKMSRPTRNTAAIELLLFSEIRETRATAMPSKVRLPGSSSEGGDEKLRRRAGEIRRRTNVQTT
jgi:hypothetical protein